MDVEHESLMSTLKALGEGCRLLSAWLTHGMQDATTLFVLDLQWIKLVLLQ